MDINDIKTGWRTKDTVLENLMSPEEAERLDSLVRPMMDPMGNDYISLEGALIIFRNSRTVYSSLDSRHRRIRTWGRLYNRK